MVKSVKPNRQMRSTTIPANFQSDIISWFSSSSRIRRVINRSSRRMLCSSLCVLRHGWQRGVSSPADPPPLPPPLTVCTGAELFGCWPRKSSSISRTLASKLREDRSFNSSSFIFELMKRCLRVIFFPGRLMRRINGSHVKKIVFTCKEKMKMLSKIFTNYWKYKKNDIRICLWVVKACMRVH